MDQYSHNYHKYNTNNNHHNASDANMRITNNIDYLSNNNYNDNEILSHNTINNSDYNNFIRNNTIGKNNIINDQIENSSKSENTAGFVEDNEFHISNSIQNNNFLSSNHNYSNDKNKTSNRVLISKKALDSNLRNKKNKDDQLLINQDQDFTLKHISNQSTLTVDNLNQTSKNSNSNFSRNAGNYKDNKNNNIYIPDDNNNFGESNNTQKTYEDIIKNSNQISYNLQNNINSYDSFEDLMNKNIREQELDINKNIGDQETTKSANNNDYRSIEFSVKENNNSINEASKENYLKNNSNHNLINDNNIVVEKQEDIRNNPHNDIISSTRNNNIGKELLKNQKYTSSLSSSNNNSFNNIGIKSMNNNKLKYSSTASYKPNSSQINDLIELAEIMEAKLIKSNDQKSKILNQLKLAEKENEYLSSQIDYLKRENDKALLEIQSQSDMKQELLNNQALIQDNFKIKINTFSEIMKDKEDNISQLENIIKQKDDYISKIVNKQEQFISSFNQLEKQYKDLQDKYSELEKNKERKVFEYQELISTNKTSCTLLVEIESLKEDNKRLLQMLKNTNEYKDFAEKADNTKMTLISNIKFNKKDFRNRSIIEEDNNNFNELNTIEKEIMSLEDNFFTKNTINTSYLASNRNDLITNTNFNNCNNINDMIIIEDEDSQKDKLKNDEDKKKPKNNLNNLMKPLLKSKKPAQIVPDETFNWVPKEAAELSSKFIENNPLLENIVLDLLKQLNLIWSNREKELSKNIKLSHKKELDSMKRRVVMTTKSDEIVNQKTIAALKKEIKIIKEENKNLSKTIEKLKSMPKGLDALTTNIIEKTSQLKTISALEIKNNSLTKELNAVKKELSDFCLEKQKEEERNKYSEERRIYFVQFEEIIKKEFTNLNNVFAKIINEFGRRLELIQADYESNPELIKKLVIWIIDSISSILRERQLSLLR